MKTKTMKNLPIRNVKVKDPFWSKFQELVISEMLPYQKAVFEGKNRNNRGGSAIENFRIAAGESKADYYGMVFQDSDLAKWIEAVAYSLSVKPDEKLEKEADEIIELIGRAQEADGYLNTYFQIKEP
ncbi:MAG TPA: glycoside hydrolase family 127 protein, partial [Clostridiales bacterium]|nr:glycoside hydrolase family 127 protein [Clostridiales bacterium]